MSATPDITSDFNRGPLTTTFIPPTTCLQTLSTVVVAAGSSLLTTPYYGHWYEGDPACYPTGTVPTSLLSETAYWATYWYSPGLYCPTGWSTAGQLTGSWNGKQVTGSTSGAICCPSGMDFSGHSHQCSAVLPVNAVVTLSNSGVVTASTLQTPMSVFADGIPLIWDESDLPATITSMTSHVPSTSATSAQSAPQTSAPLNSSSGTGGGLSEGAKIGIGIGVPLAAILIGVAIFFYISRKRRQRHWEVEHEPLPQEDYETKQSGPLELPNRPAMAIHELS